MSNTLLRTMTVLSVIGFGKYKTTTVGNLLNMKHYKELISLYYNLEKITFTEDILEQLHLIGEFAINKPGKDKEMYVKYADIIVNELDFLYNKEAKEISNTNTDRSLLTKWKARQSVIRQKRITQKC